MSGRRAKLYRKVSRVVNTTPRDLSRAGAGQSSRTKAVAYGRMAATVVELERRKDERVRDEIAEALATVTARRASE